MGLKFDCPVWLEVAFDYQKNCTSIRLSPYVGGRTKVPDCDNLVKQVMEAVELAGIVENDSQIVGITARKVE